MNPNQMPRTKAATIAQEEISRRPRTARADHIVLERDPDGEITRVTVDGVPMDLPPFAKVSCGLASDRPLPTVNVTIHAKRVLITSRTLTIEGADQ